MIRPMLIALLLVVSGIAAGPAAEQDALGKLQKKITLTFAKDTLERSIQMISDEIGVPMEIIGPDLQLEGITKNQSFGLDERDKPAAEVLRAILAKANPDGKLVFCVRKKDGTETIQITTRAAAQKRGDTQPAGDEKVLDKANQDKKVEGRDSSPRPEPLNKAIVRLPHHFAQFPVRIPLPVRERTHVEPETVERPFTIVKDPICFRCSLCGRQMRTHVLRTHLPYCPEDLFVMNEIECSDWDNPNPPLGPKGTWRK